MRNTLLATVAVAALGIGASAFAQDRALQGGAGAAPGGPAAPNASSEHPQGSAGPARSGERAQREAPAGGRSAQGQRGANGEGAKGPERSSAQNRNEERTGNQRSGAAEPDKSRGQAQQNEMPANTNRGSAQREEQAPGAKGSNAPAQTGQRAPERNQTSGAREDERNSRSGSAQRNEPNRSNASMPANQPGRTGAAEQTRPNDSARANERNGGGNVDVTGSIRVDQQKASRVHDELITRGERSNVNISVDVGQAIPNRVRVRPLPASIISISPEFRGYDYVVVQDEIVIVEPRMKKVVTIIRGGGRGASMGQTHRVSLSLDANQRLRIRRDIRIGDERRFDLDVRPGMVVPQNVVLEPLPEMIVQDVPEVREYRYFVDHDDIVLVDPNSREIIEILR